MASDTVTAPSSERPARSSELGRAARGGAVTFAGAAVSAGAGFTFNVLLARLVGPHGAGVVLQSVAVFTIALAVAKFGLDTTAVWLLPRLVRTEPGRVRPALTATCGLSFVVPLAAVAVWLVVWLARLRSSGSEVVDAVTIALVFLPAASLMTVALAATRAFGGVLAFNGVGNVLVPGLRPLTLVLVWAVGGGALAISGAWAACCLLGAVVAVLVLLRMVRRRDLGPPTSWRPDRGLVRHIVGYSGPRTVMAVMEQTIIWVDVLLVGVLLGATAAGVYGAAARFVAAGVVAMTALRIVVAPRFSALLAEDRRAEVAELYTATARWVLLLGAPIYLLLAVFSPTVLRWLGPGFADGVTPMVVLSLGSVVVLAAGNVQSLLLMSGRSGWGAFNKSVVVCFNVSANLVAIPRWGIDGAAVVWAASMALDTVLAAYQVRRGIGVSPALPAIAGTVLAVTGCVALPALAVVAVAGQGSLQLVVAALLGVLVLGTYCVLDRRRLRLDALATVRDRGRRTSLNSG
ncbi:oligosaccharide flippase family protein [Nocardioides mangrovi]|uniref:Oligosaccharide flippase family protein n=1 Tax=Nocardioides mangrovi TaxID=2874580 RepID=A0ABS7UFF4_9ACTN|nr:oligosaccharide flippase family protein [Nocardioides mangrovi]MBZ5739736.1 oligosaccharide flippase family protein [Nocardioides mangrovi]